MKQSIAWHETCYKNQTRSLEEKEKKLHYLLEEVQRDRRGLSFYADQIASAKITGKDAFDSDKYKMSIKGRDSSEEGH